MRKAIAIDFDGCLCTDEYPAIGKPNWTVINRAKAEQQAGAGLILWTCREDQLLLDAVAACERWGLTFEAVNESLPDWIEAFKTQPRKVGASEYWDDKAVNPTTMRKEEISMERLTAIQNGAAVYAGPECEYGIGMPAAVLQPQHIRKVLTRLAAYEKTGLEPEVVYTLCSMDRRAKMADLLRFEAYQELGTIEELAALLREHKEHMSNVPLTMDELREMDGKPVWVERPGYGKRWALVQVWAKSTDVIYFTYNNGSTSLVQVELDCGGKAYHRKPEEVTT